MDKKTQLETTAARKRRQEATDRAYSAYYAAYEQSLKKGYLHSGYRVFRLQEAQPQPVAFHYHDFHKIILFLAGDVDYIIEGRTWHLEPRDLIFVPAGAIHRPVYQPDGNGYSRIVIYVAPTFLAHWSAESRDGTDLGHCFTLGAGVRHQTESRSHDLLFHMDKLAKTAQGQGFANDLYTQILFVEFLILVNRSLEEHELTALAAKQSDAKIQQVLQYIGAHLTEDLSVENIARDNYLSTSYLMHKFKADTGYSLHQYVQNKRLLLACDLLSKDDTPVTAISASCGFQDYSTFSRAFRKHYQCTPKEWRERH